MFLKNTLFSILKNIKHNTIFGCQTCFPIFLFWRTKNCSRKQFSNRPLISTFYNFDLGKRWSRKLERFKPINLVGGLYKFLAKVLINRLKKLMRKKVLVY